MLFRIDNPEDPRLDPFRNIRERDLVKNKRQFMAEGKTVLQVLAKQRHFCLRSLLILENRLDGIKALINDIDDQTDIYVVPKSVIDMVAGFPMHRGVLGVGEAPDRSAPSYDLTKNWKRVVVLSGLSNHDNVGSIFRNAAAFKADAVLLDKQCCDPLYRKAIRVSVGGVFKVPYYVFEDLAAIARFLSEHEFRTIALSPKAETSLQDWRPAKRAAIILGAEGYGLPDQILAATDTVKVDMADDFDSLNVATTSGIALHHVATHQA